MRLVLCDDHRLFLEPLAAAVAAQGHDVTVTTHPGDVVLLVQSVNPDVCVLDLQFPSGSGLDAARAIRDQAPGTRVMILTARTDYGAVSASLELGVCGFVRKDQTVPALLNAIERVAQGERVVSRDCLPRERGASGRKDAVAQMVGSLTSREKEVLGHLLLADDTHAIATNLSISESTARTHVQNVLIKLGVHSRLQAVALVSAHQSAFMGLPA